MLYNALYLIKLALGDSTRVRVENEETPWIHRGEYILDTTCS